jgi:Ca-activated chloride channel family protein
MKRRLVGIRVFVALFTAVLMSQNRASLVGTVTGPAAASVPNAPLELRLAATGAIFNTTSRAGGQYTFTGLPGGSFELTVSVPGFNKYAAQIALADGQRGRHDVRLERGSVSESVTVIGDSSLLRTESSEMVARGSPALAVIRQAPLPATAPPATAGQQGAAFDRFGRYPAYPPYPPYRGRYMPGNEVYGHWVENEFTTPAADPLSTVAVDVDTASYSNIRRLPNNGQLPPPESVRIEELVNYFTYEYPLPERGKPVALSAHVIRSPWNPERLLMHVGLRTQPLAAEDLPPSNLTFLVDVSGSMSSPDKLPLVKQALQMLARQLRAQDRVAMVVYAGSSGLVLAPTPGDRTDAILQAIERLEAGGSTNGAAGIRQAYQVARQSFQSHGNNRVILATDGDFNVGVTSDDELVRLIENERRSGIFLSVLGFGTGNLKDSKMEKLADHGNGAYACIDSLAEARKIFVQEMGATLVTVAKDVKLQIEFNPAYVKEYRLVGYENRRLHPENFNNDAKDAGDLGAGHQVTAFYEIIPAGRSAPGAGVDPLRYDAASPAPPTGKPNEFAWVKLRHKTPQGHRSALLESPVNAQVFEFRNAPRDVRFAAAVAEYGLLLRHSKFAANASFRHVIETAGNALGADLNGRRTDFLDLARKAARLSGHH